MLTTAIAYRLQTDQKLSSKLYIPRKTHSLALLSIENERAKNFDFRKAIQQFASAKARRKNFNFPTTRK